MFTCVERLCMCTAVLFCLFGRKTTNYIAANKFSLFFSVQCVVSSNRYIPWHHRWQTAVKQTLKSTTKRRSEMSCQAREPTNSFWSFAYCVAQRKAFLHLHMSTEQKIDKKTTKDRIENEQQAQQDRKHYHTQAETARVIRHWHSNSMPYSLCWFLCIVLVWSLRRISIFNAFHFGRFVEKPRANCRKCLALLFVPIVHKS